MKLRNRLYVIGFAVLGVFMLTIVFQAPAQSGKKPTKWTAPKSADKLKNPFAKDVKATKRGEATYTQFCAICHGKKGKGDGIAGAALKPRPANLTSKEVQEQSDGAIFWKLTNGNPPMAAYKEALTEKQRWELVNYIRKLGESKK